MASDGLKALVAGGSSALAYFFNEAAKRKETQVTAIQAEATRKKKLFLERFESEKEGFRLNFEAVRAKIESSLRDVTEECLRICGFYSAESWLIKDLPTPPGFEKIERISLLPPSSAKLQLIFEWNEDRKINDAVKDGWRNGGLAAGMSHFDGSGNFIKADWTAPWLYAAVDAADAARRRDDRAAAALKNAKDFSRHADEFALEVSGLINSLEIVAKDADIRKEGFFEALVPFVSLLRVCQKIQSSGKLWDDLTVSERTEIQYLAKAYALLVRLSLDWLE